MDDELHKQFIREAIKGDSEAAKKLIEKDPNVVNFQDECSGLTGLMIYAADGCYSMVDVICDVAEANVTLEDTFGRSASLMAHAIGRDDIVDRIQDRVLDNIRKIDPESFEEDSEFESGLFDEEPDDNADKIVMFPRSRPFDPNP